MRLYTHTHIFFTHSLGTTPTCICAIAYRVAIWCSHILEMNDGSSTLNMLTSEWLNAFTHAGNIPSLGWPKSRRRGAGRDGWAGGRSKRHWGIHSWWWGYRSGSGGGQGALQPGHLTSLCSYVWDTTARGRDVSLWQETNQPTPGMKRLRPPCFIVHYLNAYTGKTLYHIAHHWFFKLCGSFNTNAVLTLACADAEHKKTLAYNKKCILLTWKPLKGNAFSE